MSETAPGREGTAVSGPPAGSSGIETPASELSADEVGYVRAGRVILEDVTLTAYAGQAVAITGPSGSGKSSLLALLAGLERPTAGQVRLAGVPVWPGGPALRQRYGLILQGYGLVSVLTAEENVELVLQARGLAAAEVVQRARATLDLVGMGGAGDHLVEELSGGQQQRVAVARALVADPEIVLADEPTAELDAGNRERILGLLLDEARRGRIVVLASHDREVADACDWEIRLEDGRLATVEPTLPDAESEPTAAYARPEPTPTYAEREPIATYAEREPTATYAEREPIPAYAGPTPAYAESQPPGADRSDIDPEPEPAAEPSPPAETATRAPARPAAEPEVVATDWRRPGRPRDATRDDGADSVADPAQEPAGSGWERPRS